MPWWMWSLLALLAFLALFKRILTLLILARLRLRPVNYQALGASGLDAWERELLQGAAGILTAQGFRFAGYARLPDPLAASARGRPMAFFEHASEPAWASVGPAEVPMPQRPFLLNYVTCFTNGRLLLTRIQPDRILPGTVAYAVEREEPVADFEALFASHRQAAAEMGRAAPAERIGLAALLFLGDKLLADHLESWQARRLIAPAGAGGYRLTLRGLWTANRLTAVSTPRAAKLRQAWAARPETFPLPPEAEAEAYLRIDAMGPRMGNYGKALLILASLAVFSSLSAGGFSWSSGAMLLAIVFIHEMGHALAMRWVGYRDVNVFFIPFFGAVAIGRQERHPAPWKEAFILLAGPMPAMAAGLATLWFAGPDLPPWAYRTAFTSVLVNGFNLLPIAPLDGGQLMQLILFRRFPRLDKVFLVFSAIAVAIVAWWARSPVLGFFAFVLLWGLYRGAKRNREQGASQLAEIRARYPNGRDASGAWDAGMIAEFFASFRQGKPLPFIEKLTRIRIFLAGPADGQPPRPAGVGTAAVLFAVYACIVLAPLAWYSFPFLGEFLHPAKAIHRADLGPARARLYDGLCEDSAVYQISMVSVRDTLYLHASVIAPGDTGRVQALAKALAGEEAVDIWVHAPIWGFGGLDSTLRKALFGNGARKAGDFGYGDSASRARFRSLDSAGRAAWRDSAEAGRAVFERRLDSLRAVEAAIWEAWPPERRKEWLARWKQQRARYPGATLDCFKG